MMDLDFERLRHVGLTPVLAQQAAELAQRAPAAGPGPLQLMRLTELHRETLKLHDGQQEHSARALPGLLRRLADDEDALTVGDWVLAAPDAHGQHWVQQRVPPQTRLVRRDADGRRHPVVSNVDCALLVLGLDDDFSLRRLERYIALVQGTGVQMVIVLTKADVLSEARSLYARQQALRERMATPLELLSVDARDPDTALRLAPYARAGQTLVLLGSSGAGKSTLTNTLLGRTAQDTGAVREHDSRGKHTTTARSLFLLPGGACVIDTPGLRALRPDADEQTVGATFADIQRLAPLCRFRNCSHQDEPGCKVRASIDADRLRNYQKLLREARRDTMSLLERQQQLAHWKQRGREGRTRLKMKRGEL
jgi:ribosome biogenesis GTPase